MVTARLAVKVAARMTAYARQSGRDSKRVLTLVAHIEAVAMAMTAWRWAEQQRVFHLAR